MSPLFLYKKAINLNRLTLLLMVIKMAKGEAYIKVKDENYASPGKEEVRKFLKL